MSRLRRRASPEDAHRATARLHRVLALPSAHDANGAEVGAVAAPARVGEEEVPEVDSLEAVRAALADRLPADSRGRVGLARPAATALLLVTVVAVALGASYAWRARAVSAPLTPAAVPSSTLFGPSPLASGSAGAEATTSPTPAAVVVDVAGKVRRPGVVRLPAGARVVDALEAAGGARTGVSLTTLNLARVLVDGEQILVGLPLARGAAAPGDAGGPGAPPAGGSSASRTSEGGLIDLNTATVEQLDTLPGVGPVLAQRILDWRTAHGSFSSVEELQEVSGIGDSRFADLAPRVTV